MDCIYLTVEQIDALHSLAHRDSERFGTIHTGIQIESDANARSNVLAVAYFTGGEHSDDNCVTLIEPDGATPGWER